MPGYTARTHLSGVHAEILGGLQRRFAESLYDMAQHIEAAGGADGASDDTRYHLQQALEAASCLRTTLHQISQYCGALEAAIG
jgi:hypothetical protein